MSILEKLFPSVRKTTFFDEIHEVASNPIQLSSLFGNVLKAHQNPDFSQNYYVFNKIQEHHYDDTITMFDYMLRNRMFPSDFAYVLHMGVMISTIFSDTDCQEQLGAYMGIILQKMVEDGYDVPIPAISGFFSQYRADRLTTEECIPMYHLEAMIHLGLIGNLFDNFDPSDEKSNQQKIKYMESYLSAILQYDNPEDNSFEKFYEPLSEMYYFCQILRQLGYEVNDFMEVLNVHRVNKNSMFDKAIIFMDSGEELPLPTNAKEQKHWCEINATYEKMDIYLAQQKNSPSF